MEHDRLFKELISTFFFDFVKLFLPEVAQYLEMDGPVEFLDKELFTDVSSKERHYVDILIKVRFKGSPAFFLIHVENQASHEVNFPRRMFRYFARLYDKYNLPVYPVVIFSYDAPRLPAPDHFSVEFPDKKVLHFEYTVIQLNQLSWRSFVKRDNPVAAALMSRMQMDHADRPKVKLECLRMLATLRLDPARSHLIGNFVEHYLQLSESEWLEYNREVEHLAPEVQEITLELMTHWHKEGRLEGRLEGQEQVLLRQLRRKLGVLPELTVQSIMDLNANALEALADVVLDVTSLDELNTWLADAAKR